jgi:hypothetical protein
MVKETMNKKIARTGIWFYLLTLFVWLTFSISGVNGLPSATGHLFTNTKGKHFGEQFFKDFLTIQLSCTADGRMPRWFFSQVITQKE